MENGYRVGGGKGAGQREDVAVGVVFITGHNRLAPIDQGGDVAVAVTVIIGMWRLG